MAFRPEQRGQFQPSTYYSSVDCVPAATARLINRATVDAKNPSHADVRKASGVTDKRGLSYFEAAKAAAGFGVIATPRFGITRADLRDILVSGRPCVISIDCSVTVNTPYRTNSYTGDHSVYVQGYSSTRDIFAVEDPGTTTAGYLDWPADLLYRAAEARTGGKGINVLVGPDTEHVTAKGRLAGRFRSRADVTSADKGPVVVGTKYATAKTRRGGPWKRADGTTAYGWWKLGTTKFAAGERLGVL